jgi:hypothetical protein
MCTGIRLSPRSEKNSVTRTSFENTSKEIVKCEKFCS